MSLTHKERTSWIRTCLKRSGIKATVRMQNICGTKNIQVNAVSYDRPFNADEHVRIQEIAKNNDLFAVRKQEIEIQPIDGKHEINFEFWGE